MKLPRQRFKEFLRRSHSSIKSRIKRAPATIAWLPQAPVWPEHGKLWGILPENLPAYRHPLDNRTGSEPILGFLETPPYRASSPNLLLSLGPPLHYLSGCTVAQDAPKRTCVPETRH